MWALSNGSAAEMNRSGSVTEGMGLWTLKAAGGAQSVQQLLSLMSTVGCLFRIPNLTWPQMCLERTKVSGQSVGSGW